MISPTVTAHGLTKCCIQKVETTHAGSRTFWPGAASDEILNSYAPLVPFASEMFEIAGLYLNFLSLSSKFYFT